MRDFDREWDKQLGQVDSTISFVKIVLGVLAIVGLALGGFVLWMAYRIMVYFIG